MRRHCEKMYVSFIENKEWNTEEFTDKVAANKRFVALRDAGTPVAAYPSKNGDIVFKNLTLNDLAYYVLEEGHDLWPEEDILENEVFNYMRKFIFPEQIPCDWHESELVPFECGTKKYFVANILQKNDEQLCDMYGGYDKDNTFVVYDENEEEILCIHFEM